MHLGYISTHRKVLLFTIYFINFVTLKITKMNTRLKQFLAAENISQAQFADTINVVRASVSHVLASRNNPSYDFIKAIMNNYPNLNMEWLILGKGKMYREQQQVLPPVSAEKSETIDLFSFTEEEISPSNPVEQPATQTISTTSSDIETADNRNKTTEKQRVVSKIIILYDDGSYQEM